MPNNDDKKTGLGTVNFLDVDNSGKVLTIEEDADDFAIPEVTNETSNNVPLTPEMESIVKGTYVEEQEKKKKDLEEQKEKFENKKAKILTGIIVFLVIILYSAFSLFSIKGVVKQRDIEEKTTFLTNNAVYANDIKTLYQQLASNASNYQDKVIYEATMKSKAEKAEQTIDDKINSLKNAEDEFNKYDAKTLYDILLARLNEVKRLADYQEEGGEIKDIVVKTNEFIVNENDNADTYNKALKTYLAENDIPYKEADGAIIYTVD